MIDSLNHFTKIVKEIVKNYEIPNNFSHILANSLLKNLELFELLRELHILNLFGYDLSKCTFGESLDIHCLNEALSILDKKQKKDSLISISEHLNAKQFLHASNLQINFDLKNNPSTILEEEILKVCPKFKTVFSDSLFIMNGRKFMRISPILEKPLYFEEEPNKYFEKVIVYLIQRIKFWGCYILTADDYSKLIDDSNYLEYNSNTHSRSYKFPIIRKKSSEVTVEIKKKMEIFFSKFDAIVGIINSVDSIVAQKILNIMGKFPIAIPLIIPNLNLENSYRCLLPLLTSMYIRWSPTPGKIIENNLFTDKYKLIVTLRIGKAFKGKSGKSTILNQILCAKNIFSCCGEPSGDRGKPVTLDGSVELIWLTQETSSKKLWESVLQNHYKSGANEVILLANLHGNALELEEILNILKLISTSYIVFLMPDDYENLNKKFYRLLKILDIYDPTETVSYLVVDPPSEWELSSKENMIFTSKLASDNNIAKLRTLIGTCLGTKGKSLNGVKFLSVDTMLMDEYIETKESKDLINFIKNKTCASAKMCLKLQKSEKIHDSYASLWAENYDLRYIIKLMVNILALKLDSRINAMMHLEKELNRLANKEISSAKPEMHPECHRAFGSKIDGIETASQMKNHMKIAMKNIDNINIGPEHIFREFGKLHEIWSVDNNWKSLKPVVNTAEKYAELFIAGHVIELLDGESETLLGSWLSAIFDNVYKQIPNLRVFVISIIGLQSSGKSTLLNALFSCNFAESVCRSTRGSFMRMLFIEESLKRKLKVDAILIIDTEGLGASERQNDCDAEKKDSILATFAMSISHLTLVNILGKSMNYLTLILQNAILATPRLEVCEINPDILIVQHLTERNDERIATEHAVILKSLGKAINMAMKNNTNRGMKDSNCLKSLRQTIFCSNLFFLFHPFKNGASVYSPPSEEYHLDVVELYNSILNIAEKNESKTDLMDWIILVQSLWDAVNSKKFMWLINIKD